MRLEMVLHYSGKTREKGSTMAQEWPENSGQEYPERRRENVLDLVRYSRGTYHATVFIAWIVGATFILFVIGGIVAAVQLSHQTLQVTTSSCQSQGGTDPSC